MKRVILGWLAAGILAVPMSAQALLVTVGGQAYEVGVTAPGRFIALQATLESQPWWGKSDVAQAFAIAVKGSLGFPNDRGLAGPVFAFSTDGPPSTPVNVWQWASLGGGDFREFEYFLSSGFPLTWATAAPVPLPPALYLLGLGLASLLGLGARRRGNAEV